MRLLLVYSGLGLGGVETLIVRLSNWLADRGESVTLLLLGAGDLDGLLSPDVHILRLRGMAGLFRRRTIEACCPALLQGRYDAMLSFDPLSLWMSVFVAGHVQGNPRCATGVYHPRIYFFESPDTCFLKLARIVFDRYVSDASKYFMNDAVRNEHENYFGRTFQASRIIPIPIDAERMGQTKRSPTLGRFVSVGRLTAFKSYNLYMIDVIEQLLDRGHQVEWHVYGEGELKVIMLERIAQRKLSDRIILHGNIDYTSLRDAFEKAYGFIGMGTALLEAGAAGVPCIPAIVSERACSYGFLPDLPYYTVGEQLSGRHTIEVADLLERLLLMDPDEYRGECKRTQEYCGAYAMRTVGPAFLDLLANGAGTCEELRNVPRMLRATFQTQWYTLCARRSMTNAAATLAKTLLPDALQGWLRDARRMASARKRLKAEDVDAEVVSDRVGRARRGV
jgi:glycosyltransferase involved in cell wall biosynthesis